MASVRTHRRGTKTYRYLVQSYRWNGAVRQKSVYVGLADPKRLDRFRNQLERAILEETWFARFSVIRKAYQARKKSLPTSLLESEEEEFIVDFTYDTNRIEGSTLTREETRGLLERNLSPTRPIRDVLEARCHAALFRRLVANPEPLDLPHLLEWHRELFEETKPDLAGRLRDVEVGIRGSRHLPPTPLEVRPMLLELLRRTSRSSRLENAVKVAGDFHWRFEFIHPFADGNGRVGRIAMNVLLARAGYPLLNIPYSGRKGYYRALEKASLGEDPRPFLLWLFRRYSKAHALYLRSRTGGA
jgi:Fic family protein